MPPGRTEREEGVRAAEVVGALCLATDLGMGLPLEHGLRTTVIAARLADRLGLEPEAASQAYYAALLSHAGCTADAHVTADIFGGSLTTHLHPVQYGPARGIVAGILRALPPPGTSAVVRPLEVARRLPRALREQRPHLTAMCEVAQMVAEGVGAPPPVPALLAHLTERWDGRAPLRRAGGDEIPLPMRIVHVALDAALQHLALDDVAAVAGVVRERAGLGLDPEVAAALADDPAGVLALEAGDSAWEHALACEPQPHVRLDEDALDRALGAIAGFTDLVAPCLAGHSHGVARVAAAAAERCGLDAPGVAEIRRAGLVHDLGRVAVGAATWQKPTPLTETEWEDVRLHPYHTERVLSRSPFLAGLGAVAGAHHERLDGSGYHRGTGASHLSLPARLLAPADAYQAMTEPRPHREALTPEAAADRLANEANEGLLDPDAVMAVAEAAGQRPPRLERPAGLTEREAQVVGMLARGLQTKQVARALGISAKTADHHVQNAYAKIGVSTRAAATLFAIEHGLVAWGELPIARASADS